MVEVLRSDVDQPTQCKSARANHRRVIHQLRGQATVGTRVDVAHLAATPVGMTVTITVELIEIDRRRLGFRVEVRDELDEAGKGTHERFIVDGSQRMPRLEEKLGRWKAASRRT